MLKVLKNQLDDAPVNDQWLQAFWIDFRRRFISLLGYQFRKLSPALALAVLHNKSTKDIHSGDLRRFSSCDIYLSHCFSTADISRKDLDTHMSQYDLKRLEYYARNMADYHLIVDLLPTLSKMYCSGQMGETHFSAVQLVRFDQSLINVW